MAESYISELGDSLSHGVANTNGDRVKIIAPKLYNDGNGNHPSIATALSGKAVSNHTHGNIANGGTLQTNDITIANGDKLVVTDASDSNKVARASLTFDGATTDQMLSKKGEWNDTIAKARAVVDYGSPSKAIEIGWGGASVTSTKHFAVYTDSANGYNKAIKDCTLESVRKLINGTSVGSAAVPVFINADGKTQVCTDDFVHDGDVTSTYSSTGTAPVNGTAVAAAIGGLDVSSVGGDGKYISAISETDGKISATATSLATAPVSGSDVAITAGGVYTALAAKQGAIPDAGSAAQPVHFKDGKAVAGDSINNCKLTLKVGDATVGDGFTANAGADFEYRVTGEQIASALTAGSGIAISGKTVSTNLPLSNDNAVNVKKNVWYIFAMANVTGGAWERCWDFLIASNHNSSAQMRLFISPRISASGSIESDTIVQVEGHVTPAQLAKYKIATVKDSSGTLYCCLCVKHSNSNENRTVQWNLRNARGISWWAESTPLSNYTVVSERLLSESMSSNRLVCYKPTNNAAVGNATQPVYVDAYGMIKACSSMPKFVIGTPAGAANTIYFT